MPAVVRLPAQSAVLMSGLSAEDYYRLAALVQSPQHLVPRLWRFEQWLAWGGVIGLGITGLFGARRSVAGRRLLELLGIVLAALGAAWLAIEVRGDLRVTLFQPFRMATVARGLAIVGIAGRVLALWRRGTPVGAARAGLIAGGLTGDWVMVVATAVEGLAGLARWWAGRRGDQRRGVEWSVLCASLAIGLAWLSRHDTQDGALRLGAGVAAALTGWFVLRRLGRVEWSSRRGARLVAYAWVVPAAAAVVGVTGHGVGTAFGTWATTHLRFTERPVDDEERLGAWCRAHLPADARIVGPPGPKALRLWARRPLMFNRAASPYHAAGLADWARRYCDHVGIDDAPAALAAAYLADRHGLEARYDALDASELAALAGRQGADHVVAAPGLDGPALVPLHEAGALAVYRVAEPIRR